MMFITKSILSLINPLEFDVSDLLWCDIADNELYTYSKLESDAGQHCSWNGIYEVGLQ